MPVPGAPMRGTPLRGTPLTRDRLIDGLRGLAMGGVLVVNTLAFPHVFTSSVGIIDPPGSWPALAVRTLCVAVFQAKSYPLLMFLVGYAWAMRTRQLGRGPLPAVVGLRRRQMLRQGALGIVHGLFVYFGDILSWLALLGLLLLRAPRLRLRGVRLRVVAWGALWLVAGGATLLFLLIDGAPMPVSGHWLTEAQSWPEVFALQRMAYASYLFQAPWQVPMMLALGWLGVLAGRLRILERPRIGRRVWALGTSVVLPAAIALNLALAGWTLLLQRDHGGDLGPADMASQFAGPLLAAGIVCALAQAWHRGQARWLGAFAPLGRVTMSAYVAHTLCCVLLFAGPAAALGPAFGTVGLFAFGAAYWLLVLALAPLWLGRAGVGPLERWVRGASAASSRASRRNTIT